MRPGLYLAIPLIATVLDILWACFLLRVHPTDGHDAVAIQVPATAESAQLPEMCGEDLCATADTCDDAEAVTTTTPWKKALEQEEEEERDPMLQLMPDYDFLAYVRPDISSFYQEEPGSRTEVKPSFTGQAGKFVNMSPERLSLFYVDRAGGSRFIGNAGPFEATGTATYPGHVFFFAPRNKPNERRATCTVIKGTSSYFFDPFTEDENEPGRCKSSEDVRSLDDLGEEERVSYDAHKTNLEFAKKYREFTGTEWLTLYPRDPPRHKIWRADYFGQTHTVETPETHFVTLPPEEELPQVSKMELRRNASEPVALKDYRIPQKTTMNLTLTAVSCAPRAFEIVNFLSEVEVDHMMDLAHKKSLRRSTTGSAGEKADDSDTRTSTNTWVSRYSSPIVDAIYRRAADVLRLDEALLRHRFPDEYPELGSTQPLSEDLQLVHYDPTEEYTPHHDFGYTDGRGPNSPSRFSNIIMYLNEVDEGGETSFPKWRNAETSDGLDVKPVKGKAIIFFMRTPDGNLDDTTQHAGLPVVQGEKWMTNLWVWEPTKL